MGWNVLRWAGALAGAAVIVLIVWLIVVWASLPDPGVLAHQNPSTTAYIQRERAKGRTVEWTPVALDAMAEDIKLAVLVSEDLRFFSHHGFDWYEIRAAVKDALTFKRLRGASTITQQLARNLWLSRKRTPGRKIREAMLAWKLEHTLSKRRILELYLNTAIFGRDIVGVEAAARHDYGIPASVLTRQQAARLAAALPAPAKWYPGSSSPRAGRLYHRILERMRWNTSVKRHLEALR